ncbi:MAG: hypothetical protein H6828_16160 [Planctomycetes bacterium]|nr:hypothetical protein [Planctomycetota bacterium]
MIPTPRELRARGARLGVALFVCAAPALAQRGPCTPVELVHTSCFPAACGTLHDLDWQAAMATPLVVPKFDPALGSLLEVEVRMSADFAGTGCLDNTGINCAICEFNVAYLGVLLPAASNLPQVTGLPPMQLVGQHTPTPLGFQLGPSDGFDDCAMPGVTQGPPSSGTCVAGEDHFLYAFNSNLQATPVVLDGADLAPWIGPAGSVAFDSSAFGAIGGNFHHAVVAHHDLDGRVGLQVTYRYCPPATLGVLFCTCEANAPCGNVSAGTGCANSTGAGAHLVATGSVSVGAADLVLRASGLPATQPALFFQGDAALASGAAFGDGLRCAVGGVVRLEVAPSNAQGELASSARVAVLGGASAGDVRRYQLFYRDPAGSPCGAGFNLSNGVELVWTP